MLRQHWRLRPPVPNHERTRLPGVRRVRHVKQRHLHTLVPGKAPMVISLLPNPYDIVLIKRVEVVRVPCNLQLTQDPRVTRFRQVHDEQRVNLLESHKVRPVTHKTGRVELFPGAQPLNPTNKIQLPVKHIDTASRTRDRSSRSRGSAGAPSQRDLNRPSVRCLRRHPEVSVVFVHRKLVQDMTWNLARLLIDYRSLINANPMHHRPLLTTVDVRGEEDRARRNIDGPGRPEQERL